MLLFKKIVFLLICLISIFKLDSQQAQCGFGLGLNNYWGDLEVESLFRNALIADPAVQLFFKQRVNDHFSLRFNVHLGKIHGDDSKSVGEGRISRNLNFSSRVTEYALSLEYSLWDLNKSTVDWSPYGGVGVGVFKFNPKTSFNHPDGRILDIALQPLGTEGQGLTNQPPKYSLTAMSLPVYVGLIFKVNNKIRIGAEVVFRYTSTDYLDDVSTNYFPNDDFPNTENGQLASYLANRTDEYLGLPENDPLSIRDASLRGSPSANDFFHSAMISVYFNLDKGLFGDGLGRGVDCYTF